MIAGPTIPRTRVGIRNLVREQVGLVEEGLVVLCEDMELDGVEVEMLARDAGGHPALILTALHEDARTLATRVHGSRSWFRRHGDALMSALLQGGAELAARPDAEPRILVVGVDMLAESLSELSQLAVPGLEVYQFCSFRVAGRLHLRCEPLAMVVPTATTQVQETVAATVPEGIPAGPSRDLGTAFMDLAQRTDPRLEVRGDRFTRGFFLAGRWLCELRYTDDRLVVILPNRPTLPLDLHEDAYEAVDAMLRTLLAWDNPEQSEHPEPARQTTPQSLAPREREVATAAASVRPTRTSSGVDHSSASTAPAREGAGGGRFSLEPIRKSIDRSKVSPDEFSALDSG